MQQEALATWLDWTQPDLLDAMWPRVAALASPQSLQALRGVCRQISLIAWREEPHAKLQARLGGAMPSIWPLLQLQRSGRTQPTTLTLRNDWDLEDSDATTRAQYMLTHQGCRSVTHLVLQGVLVTSSLLEAVQGLPSLTHLELRDASLPTDPNHRYQATRLPQKLQELSIQVDMANANQAVYASLVTELLALDTITHLTLTAAEDENFDENQWAEDAMGELVRPGVRPGLQTRALRVLRMPFMTLAHEQADWLLSLAPQLEELEVRTVNMRETDDDQPQYQVPWRTLRVHEFEVSGVRSLPLLGTEDLEIHMQRITYKEDEVDEEDEDIDGAVRGPIAHLTSVAEGKRRVHMLGKGDGNGTYEWAEESDAQQIMPALTFTHVVSLLHRLSRVPVRRLDIQGQELRDVDELMQGLGVLPSVSQLSISPSQRLDHYLLARLPLHIERVRLKIRNYTPIEDGSEAYGQFKRMVRHASRVPERQAHPLRLCVTFVQGHGSTWWEEVERRRQAGHTGVIMEEAWK